MRVRVTLFLLVAFLFAAIPGFSATPTSDADQPKADALTWNVGEFKKLKAALDFQNEALSQEGYKFNDLRLSPMIRSEQWYEFPIEIGFLSTEEYLLPFLKKVETFSIADAAMTNKALNVSQTAEVLPNKKVLLNFSLNQTYICGLESARKAGSEQNARLVKALARLLQMTSFQPCIRRGESEVSKGPSHWLTNLRVDGDFRVQMTGYALSFPAVTKLAEDLYQSGAFSEVFLSNTNKNVYEKVPVWRFDIVARIQ